jgi:1-phosphofructokinase
MGGRGHACLAAGYGARMAAQDSGSSSWPVCVVAPAPLLTITVESRDSDQPDVHLHAGGQGPWMANMLTVLGATAILCGPFGGETGRVVHDLIVRDRVEVRAVHTSASNGCYVEDRRSGELTCVADMAPAALNRHELDDLFNDVLAAALVSKITVLTGSASGRTVPAEVYGRLTKDLAALDLAVVADLSGDPLSAALEGGLSVLKVSHEDLLADGRADSDSVSDLAKAMGSLSEHVSRLVVLTRAAEPALALLQGRVVEVQVPQLQPVHHRGAGDSMTAGIAAALAQGAGLEGALRLGAAAGVVNVTRHGLASGQRETIERLAEHVVIKPLK